MDNRCDTCPLLFCDTRSALCQQTPEGKLAVERKSRQEALERQQTALQLMSEKAAKIRAGRAALGFKKYDRRRNPLSTRTDYWREHKRKRSYVEN